MSDTRSVFLAALACTALVLPMAAGAHCPPTKAPAKAKSHKVVKKVVVKKAVAKKVVACNCAVAVKTARHAIAHPVRHAGPPVAHSAPPPVDHAPYVDTGAGYADYGSSRVVNLNAEGWESATYTSSRIVSRRIVTYYTSGQVSGQGVPHPVDCRDPHHRHHY